MRVHFGECVLELETRRLLRAGQAVHIAPKAFQLLHLLLAARPRAVSKSELRQSLWPGTFVLDANLPNLVAEAREAIGDDARRPRFVRTVHGFGYAFCGTAVDAGAVTAAGFFYRLVSSTGTILLADGEHLLGRSSRSVIPLDSASVSRRHALLRTSEGAATLEDLGSRNGTFVAGTRITGPVPLADGDEFRLGSVLVTFKASPRTASTETGPI